MRSSQPGSQPPVGLSTVAAPAGIETIIGEITSLAVPQVLEQPMATENFDADIIVIGAGPGGYVAAIRAAQLGARVTVVEKEFLGGTCLNWGCIPSKALIASVERLHDVKHAADLGVNVSGEVSIDFEKMMARKSKIVMTQRNGVGFLFKKNKITHVEGYAKFVDKHTIEVTKDDKTTKLTAKNFILASGSAVIHLPIPGLEGGVNEGVWTSDDGVNMPHIPKSVLILGGGVIGVEFGYIFNGLGTDTTIVEMMPQVLPTMEEDLGKELGKQLSRQGVKLKMGSTLEKVEKVEGGWKAFIKTSAGVEELVVEVVFVAVGRRAFTDNMNLEGIGVKMHRRGVEVVDDTLRTSVDNIYAIGDVTGRIQLAHVASHEGTVVVHNIMHGTNEKVSYKSVPNCVYTEPEVSSVGLTEGQAREQGYDVGVGKAQFRPFGKPMAIGKQEGFVKIVFDKKYGEFLGMHMIGPHVTDLVHEGVVALNLEATIESLATSIHAHPTLSEVVLEALEDCEGLAIHKAV